MKKTITLLLVLSMTCALAACGNEDKEVDSTVLGEENATNVTTTVADNNTDATEASTEASLAETNNGYTYDLNGVSLSINAEMAPLVEQLGEPDFYFESESCAFQGLDKVYTYGSVEITTYPEDDVDYILTIALLDDTVTTPEGIYIGSTQEQVIETYGEAATTTDTSLIYTDDNGTILTFIISDGIVSYISYS